MYSPTHPLEQDIALVPKLNFTKRSTWSMWQETNLYMDVGHKRYYLSHLVISVAIATGSSKMR